MDTQSSLACHQPSAAELKFIEAAQERGAAEWLLHLRRLQRLGSYFSPLCLDRFVRPQIVPHLRCRGCAFCCCVLCQVRSCGCCVLRSGCLSTDRYLLGSIVCSLSLRSLVRSFVRSFVHSFASSFFLPFPLIHLVFSLVQSSTRYSRSIRLSSHLPFPRSLLILEFFTQFRSLLWLRICLSPPSLSVLIVHPSSAHRPLHQESESSPFFATARAFYDFCRSNRTKQNTQKKKKKNEN
jgi:hypothetical protein